MRPKFVVPEVNHSFINAQPMKNGHWKFNRQMGLNKTFGFVYLIENTVDNKLYIGKKQYRGTGAINAGKPSNWAKYTGSCDLLNFHIKDYGKECFNFICLGEYQTKVGLHWAEVWSLVVVESPSYPDIWYNSFIERVFIKGKEKVSIEHRSSLSGYMPKYNQINELEVL